ncbi:MAG: ankyrin repeat domain-containing protein, partial [Duodenibacillus sp.]|nr:ankyrin repeat domain-containing protein [Duodenibacillus sp.]
PLGEIYGADDLAVARAVWRAACATYMPCAPAAGAGDVRCGLFPSPASALARTALPAPCRFVTLRLQYAVDVWRIAARSVCAEAWGELPMAWRKGTGRYWHLSSEGKAWTGLREKLVARMREIADSGTYFVSECLRPSLLPHPDCELGVKYASLLARACAEGCVRPAPDLCCVRCVDAGDLCGLDDPGDPDGLASGWGAGAPPASRTYGWRQIRGLFANLTKRQVELLNGAEINAPETKDAVLLEACRRGDAGRAGIALAGGADPDVMDSSGRTPLAWAAGHAAFRRNPLGPGWIKDESPALELIELLAERGADPDLFGFGDNASPLAQALLARNFACCRRLLAMGADPDLFSDYAAYVQNRDRPEELEAAREDFRLWLAREEERRRDRGPFMDYLRESRKPAGGRLAIPEDVAVLFPPLDE